MRSSLSIFLIVWLVLRGLLGDAMAMEVMQLHGPSHTVTASADNAPSAHHTAAIAAMDRGYSNTNGHCSTAPALDHAEPGSNVPDHCSSCMLCHSAWGVESTALQIPTASHTPAPISIQTTLTSAPERSVLKPPIV